MGIPAPTTNLVVPPPKAIPQVATGVVLDITGDRATVDVAGSPFQVKIPGSVLGVKEGRSVQIRSEGNSRTIVAVTTALDPPNYSGTPDSIERGSTAAPPSSPSLFSIGAFHSTVSTIAGANTELAIVSGLMVEIGNNFDAIQSWMDDMSSAVEELRNKVDTMQQDLQDGTGIFK